MHINELFEQKQIDEGPLNFAKKVGAGIKGLGGGIGNAVQSYQQKGHQIQGQEKAENMTNYLVQQFMQNMGGQGRQPTMQDLVKFLQSQSLDTKSIEQTPIQQKPAQQQQATAQPQQQPTPKQTSQQPAPVQKPLPKATHPAPTQIQSKIHTGNPLKEAPMSLAQQAGGNGLRPIDVKNMIQKVVQANYNRIMSGDSTMDADGSNAQQPAGNGQQAPQQQQSAPQQQNTQQPAGQDGRVEPTMDQEPEQAPEQQPQQAQPEPAQKKAGRVGKGDALKQVDQTVDAIKKVRSRDRASVVKTAQTRIGALAGEDPRQPSGVAPEEEENPNIVKGYNEGFHSRFLGMKI